MSLDTLFVICNNAVLPAWLLLALAPRWRWTQRLVHAIWIPLPLALVYASLLLLPGGGETPEGASFGSLTGVMLFFTVPSAVLAGWIHYLVFDLFVGAWEVRDAARRGIRHLYVIPCLFLTLMFGPVGLALYLLLRLVLRRSVTLVEGVAEVNKAPT